MSPQPLDKRARDAGRGACAQLVRAVSSATPAVPFRKAAAGSALARLHDMLLKDGYAIIAEIEPFDEVCAAVSALVEVYSVSLREVVRQTPKVGASGAVEEQAALKEGKGVSAAATPEPHAAVYDQQHPGSSIDCRGAGSGCSTPSGGAAAGHGALPSSEDWVPLLVDSSALVADSLWVVVSTISADSDMRHFYAGSSSATQTRAATSGDTRNGHFRSCAVSLASALLHSDALHALSRLLSAEARRGPSRALLSPRQLATCLQPLTQLLMAAAAKFHDELLPVSPQGLRQPDPPAANSSATATTSTSSAPSPVPSMPGPTPGTSTPPAAGPSAATPAAANSGQAQTSSSITHAAASEPRGSAAVPVPHGRDPTASSSAPATPTPQTPKRLGPAVLTATAESGVVEAACRVAVGALEQGCSGRQTQQEAACSAGGDRKALVRQLLELLQHLVTSVELASAELLPEGPLRTVLTGPCVQFVLAAHSVSQMHAVDGGTTYGLPYDSLLPAVREEGKAEMSCVGAVDALHWWLLMCRVGGFQPAHRPLSPRGLFELCLREAEVAADCWRWRNGLPAAAEAAAAGGAAAHSGSGDWSSGAAAATADGVGASGSGGQGTSSHSRDKAASSGRQHGQGKAAFRDHEADTLRQAGLCRTGGGAAPSTASDVGGGSPAATNPPTATLDPSQCPTLAMQAMNCSLALMESSCGAGAGEACAGVSKGTGSGTGGSGGTDRMASPSGNADMGEGAGEAGGGGIDGQGACGGGSGDGMQEAAAHEEADGNGGVGVSGHGDGRAGQGGGAGAGTSSGGCGDAAEETYGSGSGGGNKRPVAWLAKGGPLAQRWWRAAVAAVHCAMDEREAVGSQAVTSCVDRVLDLSLAMPVSDTGPALPPAPPPALSAALNAGCLPCLERTLRTCFRSCNTPNEALDVCGGLFTDDTDTSWPLLLAFGDEREAAAFLATAAKVARRTCEERARPGGDRKACAAVMAWLGAMSSYLRGAADHVALRVAVERGFREGEPSVLVQEQGREETAATGGGGFVCSGGGGSGSGGGGGGSTGDGGRVRGSAGESDTGVGACDNDGGVRSSTRTSGGGSSDGGGGGDRDSDSNGCGDGLGGGGSSRSGGRSTDDSAAPPTSGTCGGCGTAAAAAAVAATSTAATTPTAGNLSPPEQQLMRLLSFALPLWLPLWLDLAAAMVADGRLIRSWRWEVHWAIFMLGLVQHLWVAALGKKDLRAAESWRSIVGRSGDEVEAMLDSCRRMLEREAAAAELLSSEGRGAQTREEDGATAEELYKMMDEVREAGFIVDVDSQKAMIARREVEGGWEGAWPLVGMGLLTAPCDARQVLPCCSNPRCVELAGDSEAGVVLRRCGGACGGAAAYCCAACQRAHWAAGHREECGRRGGEKGGGGW